MNILHVIHSVNPAGGGPIEGIKQLAQAKQEMNVEVVCLDDPASAWIREFPIPIHALGPAHLHYGYTPQLIPWLRRNHSRFDIVVVNGIWQFNSIGTWLALRGTQTPYCVFTHGMLDPWFKRRYPLKHLKKWLYWPWAEYRVLRDAAAVLFTTEEERRLASESFWLYRCNERVVRYGTSIPSADPERQREVFYKNYPELQGKRLLLFLGRIHEKKGPDLLIEAFGRLVQELPGQMQSFHLVLAGPGDPALIAQLKRAIRKWNIVERVTWLGMVAGDLKFGAYRCADAFVLPSHQENFGISVAEALGCGTPVLIAKGVNIWREIIQANAGIVGDDNIQGVSSVLREWMSLPDSERAKMRNNAEQCFHAHFRISDAAQSVAAVFQEIISQRRA